MGEERGGREGGREGGGRGFEGGFEGVEGEGGGFEGGGFEGGGGTSKGEGGVLRTGGRTSRGEGFEGGGRDGFEGGGERASRGGRGEGLLRGAASSEAPFEASPLPCEAPFETPLRSLPLRRTPFCQTSLRRTAQNVALFSLSHHKCSLFLSSLGVFTWNFGGVLKRRALKCARLGSRAVE